MKKIFLIVLLAQSSYAIKSEHLNEFVDYFQESGLVDEVEELCLDIDDLEKMIQKKSRYRIGSFMDILEFRKNVTIKGECKTLIVRKVLRSPIPSVYQDLPFHKFNDCFSILNAF